MLPEGWPESSLDVEFCADTPVAAARGHSGLGPNSGPPFPGSLVDPMPNQAPHPACGGWLPFGMTFSGLTRHPTSPQYRPARCAGVAGDRDNSGK